MPSRFRIRPRRWTIAVLLAAVARAAVAADAVVSVKPSAPSITLDGRLNEPAWREAPALKLVQQSPRPGEPSPYDTEVLVIITADRLYFGFVCHEQRPGRASVHTLRRDDPMEGDDTVAIALDTYGDKKTGYWFRVNAAGARADGLIADPEHPSYDWDGIWDARTARTEDGWSVEIMIPSRTLSFTPGLKEWGLNVERFAARDRLNMRWASPVLDAFFYDLSRAGVLSGTGELQQGHGVEFSPYVIGRTKRAFQTSPRAWQGAGGGEFTWKLTPQLVTVFTANTDFAETEVDSRQINITRFPLFFPEKRSFFLEGANQYEFALNMGEAFIPFFSRRIGLIEGQQIPLDGGMKLNGRIGKWNVAMLDVQTRATKLEDRAVPSVNLFAGRFSYDITNQLRVGTIVTHGDPEGLGRNNLMGFDAVWRTSTFRGSKNLLIGGWTALSAGDLEQGRRSGYGFKIDYPNDLWDCMIIVNDFGVALNPALGFLPRSGVRMTEGGCEFRPRPSKSGPFRWVRQQAFESEFAYVTNHQGFTESWQYSVAPLNADFESGERAGFEWQPQYEFLVEPFEITPGVAIPPGSYRFNRWNIEGQTSEHRPWQAGSTTSFGTFYNGRLTQWQNYVRWTSPEGRLQLGLAAENNFGHLPNGNFVQRLWQLQSGFALNPNVVLSSFIQYDTESQNVGSNTRLRWTLKPGNDVFLVWNRGWQRLLLSPRDLTLMPENELIALKIRWTFRN